MIWGFAALAVLVAAVVLYFYIGEVRSHLAVAGAAMDKPTAVAQATGLVASIDAHLMNWKTVILAWIAGLAQLFSWVSTDVITGWQQLPWANVVDAKVANWITITCAILIPIVHARGVAKAAVTAPTDPGA